MLYNQREAQARIALAEAQDGFFARVKRSNVNRLARRNSMYEAWNDQSLAVTAAALLDPEDKVDIVILDPSAEGGMPHTRPGLICLPAYYPTSKLKETLAHEMVHISQKRQASLWAARASLEGWSPVREQIPDFWASRLRLNPDTFGTLYAWEQRYVPLPVYIREDKPILREIEVRWLDLTEGMVAKSPPRSFTQTYGPLGAVEAEHPYELWAYSK